MPTNEQVKIALKEALKEWLDEKFAEVGRWTVHGILAAALAALAYYLISHGGFKVSVNG